MFSEAHNIADVAPNRGDEVALSQGLPEKRPSKAVFDPYIRRIPRLRTFLAVSKSNYGPTLFSIRRSHDIDFMFDNRLEFVVGVSYQVHDDRGAAHMRHTMLLARSMKVSGESGE